jgi:hypothetical protein
LPPGGLEKLRVIPSLKQENTDLKDAFLLLLLEFFGSQTEEMFYPAAEVEASDCNGNGEVMINGVSKAVI